MPEQKNKPIDDSVQRAIAKVKGEMPDVANVSVTPSSQSILTRFFMPRGAQATTNPFTGNVTYDPAALAGMNQNELENTIAHELTHSRQAVQEPFYRKVINMLNPMTPEYSQRPWEMAAFQAEKDRTLAQHLPFMSDPITGNRDIQLPKKKVSQ